MGSNRFLRNNVYLLSFLLLAPGFCIAQKFTIEDIPLTWNNFTRKSKYTAGSHTAAICYSILKDYERKIVNDTSVYYIRLNLMLRRSCSYVREEFMQTALPGEKELLLNHEKGHLIIVLVQLKQMQNALSVFPFTILYKKEADSICMHFAEKIKSMGTDYDNNTHHGTAGMRQLIWETTAMLYFNELYADDTVIKFETIIPLSISY
ncbi:hypothetical protein F0919_08170 [Taibaiella lutea]|uniref:DUF922 domain-containing protein n=1 Tax=Taibaiella lutea TaxID=2608001 RepID=A0A5M6CHR1_9BACT|nr:hypothetical protein [Taibaiella lutea]KAA5534587.1 hypothetical protein F0919_08170 [Taibaiella lutea]